MNADSPGDSRLTHVTLNTGHCHLSTRGEVAEALIQALAPLVRESGMVDTPVRPWRAMVARAEGCASFDLRRGSDSSGIAVLCMLVWTEEGRAGWPQIEGVYLSLADVAARNGAPEAVLHLAEEPAELPYLAVVLLPGLALAAREDVSWMGDAERTLAWAILENP